MSVPPFPTSAQTLRVCREGKPVPTFPDHAEPIKKPRTFSGGASGSDMRSSTYARTPPEAPEAWPVFAVRLVFVIMGGSMREIWIGVNGFRIENRHQRG